MNKSILAIALASTVLAGCSSVNPFVDNNTVIKQPDSNKVAVKDTRVGIVNKEGIKIFYTLLGDLDRIEIYGIAPAWKGNEETVAEVDAKERLVKFLYDEVVESNKSVKIVTRAIDKARDNSVNRMEGDDVEYTIAELEAEVEQAPSASEDNTSRRIAERVENTLINTYSSVKVSGKLRGLRKIDAYERTGSNGLAYYVAVYEWSEKTQGTANDIRSKMLGAR